MENCERRDKHINRNIFTFWALKVVNVLPVELNQFIVELIDTRILNIMVVGNKDVGKTSLIRALTRGSFDPSEKCSTSDSEQFVDTIVDKTYTRMNFFEYESISVKEIDTVKCDCIIYLYKKENNKNRPVLFAITEMQSNISDKSSYHIPQILCVNKVDLDKSADYSSFTFAKIKDIPYVRTSAKTFYGLDRVFEEIVKNTIGENKKIAHIFW